MEQRSDGRVPRRAGRATRLDRRQHAEAAHQNTASAGSAETLDELGRSLCRAGRPEQAAVPFRAAVELAQRHGPLRHRSLACGNLASALRQAGQVESARAWQQRALRDGLRPDQSLEELACQLSGRACDALLAGDLTLAEQLLVRSLHLEQLSGNAAGEAHDWGNLALVYAAGEQWRWALACLTKARRLHRSVGDRRSEGLDLLHLGCVAFRLGRLRAAARWLRSAASLLRACEATDLLAEAEAALDQVAQRVRTQRLRAEPN